jgi:hypothetical protein
MEVDVNNRHQVRRDVSQIACSSGEVIWAFPFGRTLQSNKCRWRVNILHIACVAAIRDGYDKCPARVADNASHHAWPRFNKKTEPWANTEV